MDPEAAVKGEMRFFLKKNQPGGGPPGGSPSDREIPRPPPAPLPPIPARRGAAGAGCFYASEGRAVWMASRWIGRRPSRGKMRFSRKISRCITRERRGGGRPNGKSSMRKELRRPFPTNGTGRAGEASSTRATRGAGRLYAPSCRFHKGSDAGPVARIAILPVPDAENAGIRRPPFPRPGNSPCAPNAPAAPAEA